MNILKAIKSFCLRRETLFSILTILTGLILFYFYRNFSLFIVQGDHGNNFYCFRRTWEGALPYQDYWWVYGPLMPYYYSAFYSLLGLNMGSVIIGYRLLNVFSMLVFYKIIRIFSKDYFAFTSALFFYIFAPEFPHTYNHAGGILMILGTVYFLLMYSKNKRSVFLYSAVVCIFFLSLIKINFGLAILLGFMISVFFIDHFKRDPNQINDKRIFLLLTFGLMPFSLFLIYRFLTWGLSWDIIRQCFLSIDNEPSVWPLRNSIPVLIQYYLSLKWEENFLIGLAAVLGIYFLFCRLQRKETPNPTSQEIKIVLSILVLFGLCLTPEFLFSGAIYRLYWFEPIRFLIIFLIIGFNFPYLPQFMRFTCCAMIIGLAAHFYIQQTFVIQNNRQYLAWERAKIFMGRNDDWVKTVDQVTNFLKKNLGAKETFFALPSEQIYYFLTDRNSPTRQSDFGIQITSAQEQEVITALEKQNIRYVLLSNGYRHPDEGMPPLGQKYCRRLMDYIQKHYRLEMTVGDWNKEAGWNINHAVAILKREGM